MDVMLKYKVVNEDERGEISVLFEPEDEDKKDIAILRTNRGFARGGCVHNINNEICIVIKGIIQYYTDTDLDKPFSSTFLKHKLEKGDKILVEKNTVHYYISLTDSIVIEWGATLPEKLEKHPETRKIVEMINKKMEEKKHEKNKST